MEFSSLYFLYIWLPLILCVYVLVGEMRWKNLTLLVFSLLLYAMGQPVYMVFLVGLTWANFRLANTIRPGEVGTLLKPLALNIGVLALLKYLDFFLGIFGVRVADGLLLTILNGLIRGLNSIGFSLKAATTVHPMGISFFTFSMISYLADVYRGRVEPEQDFRKLLLYVCLFPKLLQGPIVRYEQIGFQLAHRRSTPRGCFEGAFRFVIGLSKKVLLADYCARAIAALAAVGSDTNFIGAWLTAVLYMFRIYFDFSSYSDMAIGLGRIFGFTFCENFDLPYTARSITEFWRRWHISLGSFFRDYVYIPLGGNRLGFRRQILNLLAVWSLTGLWHGASWNYVFWGLYFFCLLTAEKYYASKLEKLPAAGRHALTLALVLFGWVLFAHEDGAELAAALGGMLGFGGFAGAGAGLKLLNCLPLLTVCAVACTGLPRQAADCWRFLCGTATDDGESVTVMKAVYLGSVFMGMMVLLWLCTVSLVGGSSAPSIYGNF